jgi:hypothetical protein
LALDVIGLANALPRLLQYRSSGQFGRAKIALDRQVVLATLALIRNPNSFPRACEVKLDTGKSPTTIQKLVKMAA